ncbi:MAG: sugar phosphate isomerase/epimerase [Verrucomicrobia bacterium]|nr:sugar phosphate isomerase/epimerase [Verrucomicrobiota bacterium]
MNKVSELLKRREFLKMTAQAAALALGATGRRSLIEAAESDTSAIKGHGTQRPPLIQIGILLGTFRRETLEARLDAVKACGLDCVQVSLDCAGLSAMPDEIPPEVPGRIRRAAAERGITVASLQGTFNMSHPDAERRRRGLRQLRLLAEACPQMGVSKIHLCTGTRDRDNMWRRHADNETLAAWRDMTACVREACDIARQAGVVLAFEPEVNNVVDSAQKARRLLDEIGSPFLKVTIDPANIFHAGELPRMREILDQAFALVGKDVVLAHAKDLDRDGDAGHKAAGQGKLDYDRYLSLLRTYRFRGPLLLHGLSEAQAPGCVAFLREKLARLASSPSGK